jgi:hypothetical protein
MLWLNLKEAGTDDNGIELAHPWQIGVADMEGFFFKADWKWRVLGLDAW